jgi:hypothetical protein
MLSIETRKGIAMTKNYIAPNGNTIVGILESVTCVAAIEGLDAQGMPVYAGGSEVFWDEQKPVLRNGGFVFLDESGDEWAFAQLTERAT